MATETEAAQSLYQVAKSASCRCETKWQRGVRVLARMCYRCQTVAAWEAMHNLPATPRLALELEEAK